MQWTSAIAIYFLLWIFSAFIVMPFGIRTHHDVGSVPETGHADSAPINFRPWRIVWRTTLVAAVLFVLELAIRTVVTFVGSKLASINLPNLRRNFVEEVTIV